MKKDSKAKTVATAEALSKLEETARRLAEARPAFLDLPELATEQEEMKRRQILDLADTTFKRFGTRRVTMDELSSTLHMSKKTLYKYFPSKEALVRACVARIQSVIFLRFTSAFSSEGTPRERLMRFQEALREVGQRMSAIFITDLKLEFPLVWEEVDKNRLSVLRLAEAFYEEGIAAGVVNPRIHPKVAIAIHLAIMNEVVHPDVFARGEFTPNEAIETVLTLINSGVFTTPSSAK